MADHAVTSRVPRSSIQSGIVHKPLAGPMTIQFNEPFPVVPVVVITPYLQNRNAPGQVEQVETISDINRGDFTITSNIADENYFVSWIAIGHPDPHEGGGDHDH